MADRSFQRVRNLIQTLAIKSDRKIVYYSETVEARRVKLLRHAGVQVLVDIGANVGQWASEVRRAGWHGPIWSFEPVSAAYARLSAAASADPSWHVRQVALGSQPGRMEINVSQDTVYSSLAPILSAGVDANGQAAYVQTEQVEVDTLDHAAAALGGPAGVKIDVQGFASQVMDGGEDTLRRAAFLEVEMSLTPVYDGEPLYREMLDRISGYGFRLALVEPAWIDHTTGEALQFDGLFIQA
jgi:FkbM family methyltransferase